MSQGAVLIKNLASEEPLALGLDTYYKQHYLSLAAAAATIKWCLPPELFASLHYCSVSFGILSFGCVMSRIEAEKGVIVTNHSLNVCIWLCTILKYLGVKVVYAVVPKFLAK